jgi:hypothetical protein
MQKNKKRVAYSIYEKKKPPVSDESGDLNLEERKLAT